MDVHGSLQLLTSSHVRERDKALLRTIMVGGVWNGFLLGKVRGKAVPCRFCGGADGDGHLFWKVLTLLHSEFHDLMRIDRVIGPVACCGMVGFPFFLGLVVGHLGLLVLMMRCIYA